MDLKDRVNDNLDIKVEVWISDCCLPWSDVTEYTVPWTEETSWTRCLRGVVTILNTPRGHLLTCFKCKCLRDP